MRTESGTNRKHSRRDTREALRAAFLFQQWSEDDLENIAGMATVRSLDRNAIVFHHAAACRHLYVVMEGHIQLSRLTPDGRETVIHVIGPGQLLACAALFLDRAYPATARVISPGARLLVLDGAAFLDTLRQRSDLSFRVVAALATRISKLTGRIESQATETSEQRVAAWLLRQAERSGSGSRVVLESTKKVLAENLGMTPETLSRVLSKLRRRDIVDVRRREITIHAPSRLRELT